MARDRTPVMKRCRSLDVDPSLLGIRKKLSIRQKNQNGRPKKMSEYAIQLREKQRVKFVYGVMEKQFFNYFEKAQRQQGIVGENLLQQLELRLDNIVFRLGFARTRTEARQMVLHRHFLVDGKRVNIPSYQMKVGQEITLKENYRDTVHITGIMEQTFHSITPGWLEVDRDKFIGKVKSLPQRDEIDIPFDETLIIELYSK